VVIVPRSKWGARPAKSFTPSDPKKLKGVCVHWFGSPKAVKDHKDCPALLRAVQRAHQAGEFSDVAYSHCVCQHGVVFAGRGFDRQTGANGNRKANREYAAVCAMIGEGDKPSGELKNALREVIAEWRARGAGKEVIRHGSITGSACPGPELGAWVNAKAYEVKPPVKKPKRHEPVSKPPVVPSPAEWRVDVDAGNVKLTNQNPESPAVKARIRKLLGRFGQVVIRKSK
jgi:hypothetical protein